MDLCDCLSLDTIETASGLTQCGRWFVSRTSPRDMSSPPHLLTGIRGGGHLEKQLQKLESLTFACTGICLAEPCSSAVHQRPTQMLKMAFLIHFPALAMSVALDMTQDAHKTLTVAGIAAALPGTAISCTHWGHSFTGLFFLPQPSLQAQVKDHSQSGGFHEARER